MKTPSRLAFVILACTGTAAFAQDGSPNCVLTNYDSAQNAFTVINPAPNALNQQCFLTIHPVGAAPSGPGKQFVEGSYEILLSGGGGGGSCVMVRETATNAVYVEPTPGDRGFDGNPTGLAEAYSNKTIAGFPRAESWAGSGSYEVAGGRRVAAPSSAASDRSAPGAINGPDGMVRQDGPCEPGFSGGHGFIKMTLLAQAAPPPQAAPVVEPAPAPKPIERPIRKDRN